MQSPFNDKDESGYSLEHGLCFDHPDGDSHTLMLSGHYCRSENPDPVGVIVKPEAESVVRVQPGGRPHPVAPEGESPRKPGFRHYIPLNRRMGKGDYVELEIGTGARAARVRREIVHAQDFVREYIASHRIDGLKRIKLENLILNETERIHHVKGIESSPLRLKMDTRWSCDLDCPYCHSNLLRKSGFALKDMSDDTFQNVMDRFAEKLIDVRLGIWGEPLSHSSCCRYIRAMKEFGIHVTAESHLNPVLSDEEVDEIVTCGLDRLIASVDGVS